MFTEINEKLVEIKGELRKKEKYQLQLEDYQNELFVIEQTLSELGETLRREQEDVDRLKRFSLANFFATISGTKAEKLSKEEEEMLLAKIKYEEANKTKKELDDAMLAIRNKLYQLESLEDRYQRLLEEKERIVTSSSSSISEKVFELSEQEGNTKAFINELEEAISAGEKVKQSLSQALKSLNSAENWGTWDMFGGGTISGVVKHQRINEAERHLHQAQSHMRQFQKELLDVQEQANLTVNVSGMLTFADFFFDGFIADFLVQGKITRSRENTENQLDKVKEIVTKLKQQFTEKQDELANILGEKQELLERL